MLVTHFSISKQLGIQYNFDKSAAANIYATRQFKWHVAAADECPADSEWDALCYAIAAEQ